LGLIKVELFLLAHPKMQLHCAPRAPPYVVDKTEMGGKIYGIIIIVINCATTWATIDYLA
jgi:hypothetical protein